LSSLKPQVYPPKRKCGFFDRTATQAHRWPVSPGHPTAPSLTNFMAMARLTRPQQCSRHLGRGWSGTTCALLRFRLPAVEASADHNHGRKVARPQVCTSVGHACYSCWGQTYSTPMLGAMARSSRGLLLAPRDLRGAFRQQAEGVHPCLFSTEGAAHINGIWRQKPVTKSHIEKYLYISMKILI